MAIEIVEAVRRAEIEAAKKVNDAKIKSDEILQKAHRDADALVKSMQKETEDKAMQDMQKAQDQVNEYTKTAMQKAENEISQLETLIEQKEQAAIDLIVSEITD